MKISSSTSYALSAMLYLAKRPDDVVAVKEIAEETQTPYKFLEQLFRQLKTAQLVVSTRGKEGGYQLAKPPRSLSVLAIYEAIEGKITPLSPDQHDPCRWIWESMETQIKKHLSLSLEDVLHHQNRSGAHYSI